MDTRGSAAVCKGLPSTGNPILRGYETLLAPHHWHRNCATFSTSKRLFEISPTKIFRHCCNSTRAPTTGAHHPRQQALAPECSTGISPHQVAISQGIRTLALQRPSSTETSQQLLLAETCASRDKDHHTCSAHTAEGRFLSQVLCA